MSPKNEGEALTYQLALTASMSLTKFWAKQMPNILMRKSRPSK